MKYIVFSLLLLNLAACSLFGDENIPPQKPSISESGSSSLENKAVSSTGANTSTESGSVVISSGSSVISTGTKTPTVPQKPILTKTGTSADAEVENITNDINKMFDDIAREGK